MYCLCILKLCSICSYGIKEEDIFRGVNDTTNSALRTGLLLSQGRAPEEKGPTCFMHAQELVVKHALGLAPRKGRHGAPDDLFEPGVRLRDRVKTWLGYLCNKKAKSRFLKYKEYCKSRLSIDVIRFSLPNDTRIAGVYYMYTSALRSRKPLIQYSSNSAEAIQYQDIKLTELEWIQLAETHAILSIAHNLAMQSQQESADSNCFAYFHVATARYSICKQAELLIVDLSILSDPSIEVDKLPMIKTSKNQLSVETQELIQRFETEFNRYFEKPDSDQVMMMICHPVMIWSGFS